MILPERPQRRATIFPDQGSQTCHRHCRLQAGQLRLRLLSPQSLTRGAAVVAAGGSFLPTFFGDNEEGAEGRHGHHDDADTGFDFHPEGRPRLVIGTIDMGRNAAYHTDGDHDYAEAEHDANTEFLTHLELRLPEKSDGDGDD